MCSCSYRVGLAAAVISGAVFASFCAAAPTEESPDFLIVVSAPLSRTGGVAGAVAQYEQDVKAEGWRPKVVTVNNVDDDQADYICPRPEELKQVLRQYYRNGLKGFIFIGSSPAIQTAYWRHDPEGDCSPSDYFYADMTNWGAMSDNGAYWPYSGETTNEDLAKFGPEIFWGRIDPTGLSANMEECAAKVVRYLDKVHRYRTEGSNLPPAAQRRFLLCGDGPDYKGARNIADTFAGAASHTRGLFDDAHSLGETWVSELEKGCQFGMLLCHSYPGGHAFTNVVGNTPAHDVYTVEMLAERAPKAHYLDLFCCSACRFDDLKEGHMRNLGATYLFENDYVLNVTGSTGGWGFIPLHEFWDKLAAGEPLGETLRSWFAEWVPEGEHGCPKGVLLGDPTIRYHAPQVENKPPRITTRLEGQSRNGCVEAFVDTPFSVLAADPDGDPVVIEITGLPSGAKIERGDGRLIWTPTADDAGKTLKLYAKAYNADADGKPVNLFEEEFTLSVRTPTAAELVNGGFEETASTAPAGWTVKGEGWFDVDLDKTTKVEGAAALRLQAEKKSEVSVTRETTVKPFTRYMLLGQVRAENVATMEVKNEKEQAPYTSGAFLIFGQHESQPIAVGKEWTTVCVTGRTGDETTARVGCRFGEKELHCTGAAWFDGLRLFELPDRAPANLDFEQADGELPASWAPATWNASTGCAAGVDSSAAHGGRQSGVLHSLKEPGEIQFCQQFDVQPKQRYRCTGYVKTADVKDGAGARIYVTPEAATKPLHGDNDWTQVEFTFDAEDKTEITIKCGLGWHGSLTTGKAWFDDLTVELVGPSPSKPAQTPTTCRSGGC